MKITFSVISVICASFFFALQIPAQSPKRLEIKGKLLSAEVDANETGAAFNLRVELEFINNSGEPVILPRDDYDLHIMDVFVSDSGASLKRNAFLYRVSIKESVMGEDKDFTKSMSGITPPLNKVIVVQSGGRVSYKTLVGFSFEKKQKYTTNKTWDEVNHLPSFWLQIGINLYFDNDLYRKLRSGITFGENLRKKWIEYGDFQYGRVYSVPIEITMSR